LIHAIAFGQQAASAATAAVTNGPWRFSYGVVQYQHTKPRSAIMILYVPLVASHSIPLKSVDYGIPPVSSSAPKAAAANARYRERDFGVGYGSSSGYASDRGYVVRDTPAYFRCR
jgi:hypothetical protein